MEVFGGVLVLRRITASHMPAGHAHAKVNPSVADFYAVFANVLVRGCDLDLIQMLALFWHFYLPARHPERRLFSRMQGTTN
jgi:hypothetical protein